MPATAVACSSKSCRRTTTDPSGRCHDHRGSQRTKASAAGLPAPSQAVETWVSGRGMVHPTGGYDTVRKIANEPGRNYYREKNLHREDGPAVEYEGESEGAANRWLIDGKHHREGAPAAEYQDGSFEYFEHGKRHRLDGPAVFAATICPEPPGQCTFDCEPDRYEWWVEGVELGPVSVAARFGDLVGVEISDRSLSVLDTAVKEGRADLAGVIEAAKSGAPPEWAVAYAEGGRS